MIRSLRNRRVLLCLLASLAVHMLFLWAYQRWAAESVLRVLRPARFELAPSLEPQRFEPAPRATVPDVVMEQLRLAELMMEAPLPEDALGPPSPGLEGLAPEPGLEADPGLGPALLPGDTLSYDSALTDLYRRKLVELHGRRVRVLPLADTTSEAGRRRTRARQIIDRAIEAMGGLERLQAIRDKRIRVERWNHQRQIWEPGVVRSYLRGRRYRVDIGPAEARGYDGMQSWYLRYGLLLPPGDERHNAERWDFLTRFRGDGVIVEYVGRREMRFRTLEAVRVIDTKFGRQRLAYFDPGDSLLHTEVEGGRTTTYRQYRETGGVLTPFEVLIGRLSSPRVTRYRWHTELNAGLTADLFEVPQPVSWEPEVVRMVVFEHAPVPTGGPAALSLRLEELDPGVDLEGRAWLDPLATNLLRTYMKRKLEAAGVLAEAEPDWRLSFRVEGFWVVSGLDGGPPVATIVIAVRLQSLTGEGLWEGEVKDRWRVRGAAIDDQAADHLTFEGISRASAGLKALLDARTAVAQPASTPSAGSSSGSE